MRILTMLVLLAIATPALASGFFMPCWFEVVLIAIHSFWGWATAAVLAVTVGRCFGWSKKRVAWFALGVTAGTVLGFAWFYGACR